MNKKKKKKHHINNIKIYMISATIIKFYNKNGEVVNGFISN